MDEQTRLINNPDYRANVGIMLINRKNQVLAGEAIHYPGEWMMPQGGIDDGETTLEAMQRELAEETGILFEDSKLIHEHHKWLSYQFRRPLFKDGALYIGQRQKWFLLEYNGSVPDAEKTQDREFSRFAWVDQSWLITHTTTFKRDVYRCIFAEFDNYGSDRI